MNGRHFVKFTVSKFSYVLHFELSCVQVRTVPAGSQGRPHAAHQSGRGVRAGPHPQHEQCK